MANNRYIDIDADTRVGYNFILSKFYVTNKNTTTYRTSVQDIQDVLHALDITDIEDATIQGFQSNIEEVTDIYFTYSDTGAYIATVQFNAFKEYPLTISCEKRKIYIMNSTIIFDLDTKESPKIVRVPKLCSFYKDTLGLNIPQESMLAIYEFLVSFYNPTCYKQILPRETMEDPILYGDTILLSNYNNTANAVYNLKINPRNIKEPLAIGDIININADTNTITLANPISSSIIEKYNIGEGTNINVSGTTTIVNETEYSSDGEYTIASIKDNNIVVEGIIPTSYSFIYPTCSLVSASYEVISMERNTNAITLSDTPNNILVGDTIHISGATIITEYETISCNGAYTVENIQGNTITVSESIPTNFTGNAILEKYLFLSDIKEIKNNIIYFKDTVEITLQGSTVIVYNNSIETRYTVLAQETSSNSIVVSDIEDYAPQYPNINYNIPSKEIMVNTTSVKESKENLFPLGEFLIDTPEQAQSYLNNYSSWLVVPKDLPIMVDTLEAPNKIFIKQDASRVITMVLVGIYNEIYNEEKG